ncbi:aldo/keto reductase [Herbiconiux sp. CPCC 203407]|uniref:Aldo/keto reductase n=1 Tax=Herbiconiux oxytropis TaxID=2970915 RepID=A0AA41XA68_9MICO|nr:aldo/keto reductase [Herbiconiux oxytropis]MCS5721417.1 aldo/keto reductase [Herbiconiux oxytropis]MCS5724494.1 aldo/keto reductase [Herbiconiux oxytropis]
MADALSPLLTLNDSRTLPQLGLGVYKTTDDESAETVSFALQHGYRLVDTAAMYLNESGVGEGLRRSGLPREEVTLATKVWFTDNGFDSTLRSFDESLERLGTDYVDLYLIHWPAPANDLYVETWRALVRLREEGRARSIGVANFHPKHVTRLIDETGEVPSVNQVELHPWLPQSALREFDAEHGIVTQAWSPLARGHVFDASHGGDALEVVARKHGKSPAQVVIRWHLQLGNAVIPKSVTPSRIRENIDVFDFTLDAHDLAVIATLETGERTGVDPDDRN